MFNIFDREEEKEDRTHQDNTVQYCPYCNEYVEFIWDRCPICKGN